MRRIVFLGNRQAAMLADIFEKLVAPWTGDHVAHVGAALPFSEADAATIGAATLLAVQQVGPMPPAVLAELPAKAERHVFPALAAPFLWPFAGVPHPASRPYSYLPTGPYPGAMGDAFLNRMIGRDTDPEEAARRYLALDIHAIVDLDALLDRSIARQRERDQAGGYSFAATIAQDFREQPLFDTPDDPQRSLSRALALAVMQRLGADADALARIEWHYPMAAEPRQALPIHPAVARHFGLRFFAEDARYPFLAEGSFTFADYVRGYLRGEWNAGLHDGIAQIRAGQLDTGVAKLAGSLP